MKIFLTGITGNVGSAIAEALSAHQIVALVRHQPPRLCSSHVEIVNGSLEELPESITGEIEAIVHAAADTSFRAPLEQLRQTNVEGTRRLLEFASRCPRLQRFVHLSTVCVSGKSTGKISETPCRPMPDFLNGYEQTKWEAEELVLASGVPAEIVRLSIVAGSECNGTVVRLGALHHAVHWLWRGLIPMLPGNPSTPVDLISAEHAARGITSLFEHPVSPGRIVHTAAGSTAPTLQEVLDLTFAIFAEHDSAWARGAIERPVVVDFKTWALFSAATVQSGDVLYQRVIADAQTFLPGLLHPRTYDVSFPDSAVAPDWRQVVSLTVKHLLQTNWHRINQANDR